METLYTGKKDLQHDRHGRTEKKPGIRAKKNGASDRNRTGDNHVGNVMLYQLSYTRTWNQIKNGASDRNRTGDNHVGNVMLYQLSYTRTYATLSDDTIYDTAFLKFCK